MRGAARSSGRALQLVLSDQLDPGGPTYGLASARLWRFVDLAGRFDSLLAGLGWCPVPGHLVAAPVAEGTLVALEIEDDAAPGEGLLIYAARRRDCALGSAGRWLLDMLRQRFAIA